MTIKILTGDSQLAWEKIFSPLATFNTAIQKSKDTCQHDPYVSLRTYQENKLSAIQVYPVIVDNYNTMGSALSGGLTKTRDLVSSSLSRFGYSWNISSDATALMLKTATLPLQSRITDLQGSLPDNAEGLSSLVQEIKQIKTTLQAARGTLCHVFNSTVDPTSSSYEHATLGSKPAIRIQYDALNATLGQLKSLKTEIGQKLVPSDVTSEVKKEKSAPVPKKSEFTGQESDATHEVKETKPAPAPKNLEFTSPEAASAWFKHQAVHYRKVIEDNNWTGDGSYRDLMTLAKNSVLAPQSFYKFSTTLDASIRDPMESREFFQEFYARGLKTGLLPPTKDPVNNFQELLCQMYVDRAPRWRFQNVFRALLNEPGNGPYGLKSESKIINEIFRSDFFALFDTGHKIQ